MEYNTEPGIDGRTHFLFKINGYARGISLRELLHEKIPFAVLGEPKISVILNVTQHNYMNSF